MELKITCASEGRINYKEIRPFQGNLKSRSNREIIKLSDSIIKHGISFPFFIWKCGPKNMCIDGHGRLMALEILEKQGHIIPEIPFVEIFADNEAEAKKKLLFANCHYGDLTYDLVLEFVGNSGIDLSEFLLPNGKMSYEGDVAIDFSSFEIVIPKINIDEAASESNETVKEMKNVFKIGKTSIELSNEEAAMLNKTLGSYCKDNNGLFGFINAVFGG
jgi:hypothetical protein